MSKSKPIKYDVQSFLRKYMPEFYSLVEVQSISWSKINKIFARHLNKIKDEYRLTQTPVLKDATFYSIVISKIKQDGKGDGMLDFFNLLFKTLSVQLGQPEKKLIHKTLYNILTEVDKNYLNFIGELAVLSKELETGKYKLLRIEEKIKPNSNVSADFHLFDTGSNFELLIEVINIHLEDAVLTDETVVKNHIGSKITEKINDKFSDTSRNFILQPVIWTSQLDDLKFLREMYTKINNPINVGVPYVYFTLMDSKKTYEHHFEKVDTISLI